MLAERLNKPWYVFRPDQIVRRLDSSGDTRVLPWGVPIQFEPDEVHGREIKRTGLIDPIVTETLFRLADRDDVCLDVGANIGHMASALAVRAGPAGRVMAFEPSPRVLPLLQVNARLWADIPAMAPVEVIGAACSAATGEARLALPTSTASNGLATLEPEVLVGDTDVVAVATVRLDDVVAGPVGVLKIDVEGHELSVLEGAGRLLDRRQVRDIVFEEHRQPPTAVTTLLGERGYALYRVDPGFARPRLSDDIAGGARLLWHPANYLATLAPRRAEWRLSRVGWRCLRPRPSGLER